MKKEIVISIQPITRLTYFTPMNQDEPQTRINRQYMGSVWGKDIRFSKHCFDLLDEHAHIIYTGYIKDLHARDVNDRTFPDDVYLVELVYTPIENISLLW